jgi:hypothetical protein
MHGGFLWLEKTYPINSHSIHNVLGLQKLGEDESNVISVKNVTLEYIYKKYGTYQGMHGMVISLNNDMEV